MPDQVKKTGAWKENYSWCFFMKKQMRELRKIDGIALILSSFDLLSRIFSPDVPRHCFSMVSWSSLIYPCDNLSKSFFFFNYTPYLFSPKTTPIQRSLLYWLWARQVNLPNFTIGFDETCSLKSSFGDEGLRPYCRKPELIGIFRLTCRGQKNAGNWTRPPK
jgi:hypothetical protein